MKKFRHEILALILAYSMVLFFTPVNVSAMAANPDRNDSLCDRGIVIYSIGQGTGSLPLILYGKSLMNSYC